MSTKSTAIFDFLWKNLQKLIKFITKSYLSPLNSFLFSSRFSVSLKSLANNRWFPYKSLLSRFSVLISYNMWTSNQFSISSRFQCFSRSRFFRVQVFLQGPGFQGPGPGFRSSRYFNVVSTRLIFFQRNIQSSLWNFKKQKYFNVVYTRLMFFSHNGILMLQ